MGKWSYFSWRMFGCHGWRWANDELDAQNGEAAKTGSHIQCVEILTYTLTILSGNRSMAFNSLTNRNRAITEV